MAVEPALQPRERRSAREAGELGDLLADPLAEGEYERVLEAIETQELLALLSGLSEREREILRARYGRTRASSAACAKSPAGWG